MYAASRESALPCPNMRSKSSKSKSRSNPSIIGTLEVYVSARMREKPANKPRSNGAATLAFGADDAKMSAPCNGVGVGELKSALFLIGEKRHNAAVRHSDYRIFSESS